MKNKLTEGSIIGSVFRLSWPIILANILQTAYNLIDTFWVGRVGPEAVAAVSFGFPVIFLMVSAGAGLGIAGTILVAHCKGRGDERGVDYAASQTILDLTVIAVFVSVLGVLIARPVVVLMGAEEAVVPGAAGYMRIVFAGVVFLFGFFALQSLLRGVGEVKVPLYIVLGTVISNAALDPVLIMGWGPIPAMGVEGAALATVINQGVAAIIMLRILIGGRYGIRITLKDMRPNLSFTRRLFALGIPTSLEHSIRSFSFTMMIFLVGGFGTVIVASYGIVMRILSFVIIPALGISTATTALVGQNMGAEKPGRAERVGRISAAFTFFILGVVGAIFWISAEFLVGIFIPESGEVIEAGARFLRIVSWSLPFVGLQIVFGGLFRGAGRTTTALGVTALNFILLRLVMGYTLSEWTPLGEIGIWWAFPISNLMGGLTALFLFRRGGWKETRLVGPVEAAPAGGTAVGDEGAWVEF